MTTQTAIRVPSKSKPDVIYTMVKGDDGWRHERIVCEAAAHNRRCWHVEYAEQSEALSKEPGMNSQQVGDPAPGTAIVTLDSTVALPVPVDMAVEQWDQYQELTRRLLNESDYQEIGQRKFKKKSAWRKYARAFNITDRVTYEEITRDEDGFPLWARIRVEAKAPNGRTAEADHECHVSERCCAAARGLTCEKADWNSHTCCITACDGRIHWSHPGDLPATALTRAKNRAIADLIGAGEVSAEEMTEESARRDTPASVATTAPAKTPFCPTHKTAMRLVPAGTSKKSGKPYDAFWGCKTKECSQTITDQDWRDHLERKASEAEPGESIDPDDLPFE